MECFPFSDLRIFSLSIPLCEWLTSTPFPFTCLLLVLLLDFHSCTGLVSRDKIPQVITRFYLSPHSPPTFEVVLGRFGSLTSPFMYLLAINQALPYGCSFVTYGHPEGSAAGDVTIITIIWNDVFK